MIRVKRIFLSWMKNEIMSYGEKWMEPLGINGGMGAEKKILMTEKSKPGVTRWEWEMRGQSKVSKSDVCMKKA